MNENDKQAEPVAWRPILQHPIPWVTGKPQESDIRHWTSQDCEIEYAYTHPAQPVQPAATPEEFNAQSFFSLWSSYCDKKMEIEDLKAINEQLLEALKLVLPLAKGYAAKNDVGGNQEYCVMAEAAIAEAEKAKGGV